MTQKNLKIGGGGAIFQKYDVFFRGVIQNTILFYMGEGVVKKGQNKSEVSYGRPLRQDSGVIYGVRTPKKLFFIKTPNFWA